MKGSIKKRCKSWTVVYDLPAGPDGKRRQRRETVTGSRGEAQRLLTARLHEMSNGVYVEAGRLTFGDLADRFLASKSHSLEPTTLAWYTRNITHHVRPIIGSVRIDQLQPAHVQRVIDEARGTARRDYGKPLHPTTLRNVYVVTHGILKWGVRMGLLTRNSAQAVSPPKCHQRDTGGITAERVRDILNAVKGTDIETIVVTAIGTGLRRSELCALYWDDINLADARFSVRRAAVKIGHEIVIKPPKTRNSARTGALPAFVVTALKRHRLLQAERRLAIGIGNPSVMAFDRLDGRPWDPNELSKRFSSLMRRAKIGNVRLHDLRHAYATLCFAAGTSLKTVSEALGHSSIATTSGIYVHVLDHMKRENAERLDTYLGEVFRRKATS